MSPAAALDRTRAWTETGTALFLASAGRLGDAGLDAPSSLPGWTRRHVIAHVGLNAEALRRLVRWASTGEPTPMYSSPEQRASDIADAAAWPPGRLRAFLAGSAARLAADLDRLPPDRWGAQVRTAQGRAIPASEIGWMRVREVAVHAVDLEAGARFEDLPEELCAALVTDAAQARSRNGRDPALELRCGALAWSVAGPGTPALVEGTAPALARWLTGRGTSGLTAGRDLPELSPWL